MSATHLHLLMNHLPVMGSAIAIVLLAWALMARSRDLTRAGLVLVIVCGVGGYLTNRTGHSAEHQVGHLPWADRGIIHEHEEAADWAWTILGLAAVAGVVALRRMKGGREARIETMVVLGLVTFGFAAAARTALLGGRIRHEEVRPGFVFPAESGDHDEH